MTLVTRRDTGRLGALLLTASLLPACLTGQANPSLPSWDELDPPPTTRREVYERFGAPQTITVYGDGEGLTYDSKRAEGMAIGFLGFPPGLFSLSHRHQWPERITFFVDAEDRVVGGYSSLGSRYLERRLWPFGDYGPLEDVPLRQIASGPDADLPPTPAAP